MINKDLLSILQCPDSRLPLDLADDDLVAAANRAIAAGRLKNRTGATVESTLDGGLIRDDGEVLYPIVDGIPILLADEAIPLDQLT